MIRAHKRKGGMYYFRQRVPADLIRPEKPKVAKNEREAVAKFRIVAAEFQTRWDEMRKGVQSLSHKRCVAPSKEIYDDFLIDLGLAPSLS